MATTTLTVEKNRGDRDDEQIFFVPEVAEGEYSPPIKMSSDETWLRSGTRYAPPATVSQIPERSWYRHAPGKTEAVAATPAEDWNYWPIAVLERSVAAMIHLKHKGHLGPQNALEGVTLCIEEARSVVSEIAQSRELNVTKTNIEFARALYVAGANKVKEIFPEALIDQPFTSGSLHTGVASNSIIPSHGIPTRTVINVRSCDRNLAAGPYPNIIQVPIASSKGIGLMSSIRRVTSVKLLETKVGEEINGSFFIRFGEVSIDYNRQTDPFNEHCHFKCTVGKRSVRVLAEYITLPSPIDLTTNLTFRLTDLQKQLLDVEQDIFRYASHAWDDVNQAIVFETMKHGIRNADPISIRGITCTEDQSLFADSNRFRAQVVDLTHVRIFAWRPQQGLDPEDGRHIVSSGGFIVSIPRIIELSIEIEHQI